VSIDVGLQETETEVMEGNASSSTAKEPDWVGSCAEVAVTVAIPRPVGVKTPLLLTVPRLEGLTLHVTAEL
jgi:hypothetical protein